MDENFLQKIDQLKKSYDKYLDVLLQDDNYRECFYMKMDCDGNIEDYYLVDVKLYRKLVISMNKELNPHILEVFEWDTILNLHKFEISYKSLASFIIDEEDYFKIAEIKIRSFFDAFKSKSWILEYQKHCKLLGVINLFHPKYQQRKGRPKQFADEEYRQRRIRQLKRAQTKYFKSEKGKSKLREASKKYYEKKKMNKNITAIGKQ